MDQDKGGRPREGAEAKRAPLNMRTSPIIRARLEREADRNYCSLTQEVERRLQMTFDFDDNRGGGHNQAFFTMAIGAIRMVEERTGKTWNADAETFWAAKAAVERLMQAERPNNPPMPDGWQAAKQEQAAAEAAWNAAKAALDLHKGSAGDGLLGLLARGGSRTPEFEERLDGLQQDYIAASDRMINAQGASIAMIEPLAAAQKAAQAEGVGNAETMLQTYGPKLHAATQ